MKQKHVASERSNALAVLSVANVPVGADYTKLRPEHITALAKEADRVRFQAPRGVTDRVRFYHDMMQRRAKL